MDLKYKNMKQIIELKARPFTEPGPDPMSTVDRKAFFQFYKTHRSRRLFGFFRDIERSNINNMLLSKYLKKKNARCLIVGYSHWANAIDLEKFLKKFNKHLSVDIAAIDVLSEALIEGIKRNVSFTPLLSPAQKTPFCDKSFDILIADGLLNCCCFEQHEPIVKELHRIAKSKAVLMLGLTYSNKNRIVKWSERPIVAYCRPLEAFKNLFHKYGFSFPQGSSIITAFTTGSGIATDNCIARK